MKTYVTGALFSFAVTIIGLGLNFLFNIYLARSLGSQGFGQFSAATAIFNILCIIAVCGLDNAAIRLLASDGVSIWAGAKRIGILAILNVSLVFGLSFIFIDELVVLAGGEEFASDVMRVYLFAIPSFVVGTVFLAILQARHDLFVRMTIKYVLEPLVKFLAVGVVLYLGLGLYGLVVAVNFSLLVSAVVAGAFVLRLCKSSWSDSDSTKAVSIRSIVAFVLPLIFGMALTSVSSRSDVMLLTLFRSAKEVGIYSAAFQIASILAIVLQCVETVILSRLSKSIQDNDVQSLTFFYSSGLSLGYLIGLPLFIAFMIFNKELLAVYGGDFKDAGLCLQVLSVAQIFNLATGSANAILVFSGRTTIVFINSFVVCAIQISLNYLLVPNYGILGASTSFCMAYLTLNLLRVLQVYLFLRVHPFRKIVLFPTIFAAIGCYLLGEFGSYQVFEFSSYEKFACFVGIVILIYGSVFLFLGTSRLCTLFTEVKSVARSVLKV